VIALTNLHRFAPFTQQAGPTLPAVVQGGFTLLELLLVMVIAAMTIGLVSLNIVQSNGQAIQKEAQRIALLLQLGRDEAILRNRPVAFEAGPEQYQFLAQDNHGWQPLHDDMLHLRTFQHTPVHASIVPAQISDSGDAAVLRIVFGREPVDKPFLLTLSVGDASAAIRADGIGHFVVEQTP